MSGKAIAYFFFGFVAGLLVVELTDGKPAKKAKQEMNRIHSGDGVEIYPNQQDAPQQDTFNSQRPNNSSGSSRRNN